MKDIRPEFTPEEYDRLKEEADRLGVPLKKLVHDRAVQADAGGKPLTAAQILSMEMSQVRELLNQIIRRESSVEIRLYDENGRKRTLVELICMLIIAIYRYEKEKNAPAAVQQRSGRMVRDHRLENMINSTRTAREMNIRSAEEVAAAIADTGKQMNALKREKSRHEKSIRRHEEILTAWDTYRNTDPDEDPEAFRQAYALLAQNRILTEKDAEELRQRYCFEQQKIIDYDKRLPELNRRYRNLKYLQQMTAAPDWTVEQIKREFGPKEPQSLEEQIKAAQMQKSAPKDVRKVEPHRQ